LGSLGIRAEKTMIEAPLENANEEQFMYSIVPLRRDFLCQAGLFDERTYSLPKVLPGQFAVITDADECEDNFKRGRVIAYDYSRGTHTILIESREVNNLYGYEIVRAYCQEGSDL
jgi:hypothetical protein